MDVAALKEYYDESRTDYEIVWRLADCHALHAGFHDETTDSHAEAVDNTNRVLADAIGVGADDRVLDCGCGVGGSAAWLAAERDATVHGIDVVPMQLADARALARERGVADRVTLSRQDYARTGFPDDAFDVCWAVESVCHGREKAAFVAEAARVLADGGRLVVADAFRTDAARSPADQRAMDRWQDAWAVPNLTTVAEFASLLESRGFAAVETREVTGNVMPSARRLYWASRLLGPLERVLHWVGYRSDAQTANRKAARYQYETLRDGYWTYAVVTAERPS
ncbi:MAG: methyltransferase domain-containing protein [Haloarculaceae archaeon]